MKADRDRTASLPAQRLTWTLFAAQLWMLAAFVSMSLSMLGAKELFTGDGPPAPAFAAALVGAALAVVSWRRVARRFERAAAQDNAPPAEPQLPASPRPGSGASLADA
jgi:hypothetical protein